MRSPWLMREYILSDDIEIEDKGEIVILKNKTYDTKLEIDKQEYNRLVNNSLNEIEWEKYFFQGFAKDKNYLEFEINEPVSLENKYFLKSNDVKNFKLKTDDKEYMILINPDLGSWMAFSEDTWNRYLNDKLDKFEWFSLFIRGLAKDKNDTELELDFPLPAEYPSVIVVNITTGCNLRCKYCFADCGEIKAENMTEDVMEATIKSMLAMPQVEMITFEFQGGEASTNIEGMKRFIEIAEDLKSNYNKIVKYRVEINGTIVTDELINLFKKYDVSIGISVDGPKEMTDQARVDINGNGVFDQIDNGIKKIREAGLDIDGAVCTIGQHNVSYPKELMEYFNMMKMNFKPRPVNILGREKKSNLTTKPGEWAKCFSEMHQLKDCVDIENFSIHIFEENVYTPIRDYICLRYPCGAARELVTVNPNGDVFPCDGFKSEEKFLMGNVLNETIEEMLDKPEVQKLRARTAESIEKCSKCLFRGMCCSCCYSAFGKFGSIYREDPHCLDKQQIYLYLMKHWLEKND